MKEQKDKSMLKRKIDETQIKIYNKIDGKCKSVVQIKKIKI